MPLELVPDRSVKLFVREIVDVLYLGHEQLVHIVTIGEGLRLLISSRLLMTVTGFSMVTIAGLQLRHHVEVASTQYKTECYFEAIYTSYSIAMTSQSTLTYECV